MTVRELITMLSDLPQDLPVVISTGTMQDRETVTGFVIGDTPASAWTPSLQFIVGPYVELI